MGFKFFDKLLRTTYSIRDFYFIKSLFQCFWYLLILKHLIQLLPVIIFFQIVLIYMQITKSMFRCCLSYTTILFALRSLAFSLVNTISFWSSASPSTNLLFIEIILANIFTSH